MRRVDGVVLEGDDILLADYLIRNGVEYLQRRNGGVSARALTLHHQFAAEAARNQPAQVSVAAGSAEADTGMLVTDCPREMAAQVAAARLGVTSRTVRNWCHAGGPLIGRKQGSRWVIEEWSVTALAAKRKDCNAPTTL